MAEPQYDQVGWLDGLNQFHPFAWSTWPASHWRSVYVRAGAGTDTEPERPKRFKPHVPMHFEGACGACDFWRAGDVPVPPPEKKRTIPAEKKRTIANDYPDVPTRVAFPGD